MSFDTAIASEGTASGAPRLPPIQRRGTVMFDLINEEYLLAILDDVAKQSKPLSRDDFYTLYRRDIRSGYAIEVDEAARRYFAKKKKLGGIKALHNQV
jgi:hypothetical protein